MAKSYTKKQMNLTINIKKFFFVDKKILYK